MNIKYFLISILIFVMVSCTPTPMYAQWLVTDPSSITQRLTLFLEELSEAMQERYTMEKQTDNTSELVEQNKESQEKLKKISNYIKTALVVQEIADETKQVMEKIKNIKEQFSKLDKLTKEEVYNAMTFTVELGEQVMKKLTESNKMSKTTSKNGEMTDYERLQVLNNIKEEIVNYKKLLTNVETRFKSKNSYETFAKQARSYTREALFMAFESENDVSNIKVTSTKSTTKKTSSKSTKKSK